MSGEDIQSIKIGGYTLYVHRQTWARADPLVDRGQLASVFIAAGLSEYLGLNTQSLSSYVREVGDGLGEDIKAVLEIDERISLRGRKAS